MKGRTKAGETNDRRQRIKQPKPMPHDDEDNVDPDQLPLGIMRKAMDVRNAWVNCHRRACKRGRACRGRQVQCIGELSPRKRRGDPDKRQRDDARSRAILQRILHERMAAREAQTMDMRSSEALPVRARKRPRQAR